MGSGTDRTAAPHVTRADAEGREVAVLRVSNPSSPVSPETPYRP